MQNNRGMKFFNIVIALSLLNPAFVQAQHHSDVHTVEALAIQLFNRGDIAQAEQEFKRLLRMDPDNKAAQQYIMTIQSGRQAFSNTSTIARNITGINNRIAEVKQNITRHERRNRELEFLVQDLMRENDILFRGLSERNREVIKLRKELSRFGHVSGDMIHKPSGNFRLIEQSTENEALMNNILHSYKTQLVERDRSLLEKENEITQLRQEIQNINQSLSTQINTTITSDQNVPTIVAPEIHVNADRIMHVNNALNKYAQNLSAQQQHLITKETHVIAKNEELTRLRKELAELKHQMQASSTKVETNVEYYNQEVTDLKSYTGPKNMAHQLRVHELRKQMEEQLRDFARLQQELVGKQREIERLQQLLLEKDSHIARLDQELIRRDRIIVGLKDDLAKAQRELAQANQELAFVDENLTITNKQVLTIASLAEENQKELDRLRGNINKVRGQIDAKNASLAQKEQHIRDLNIKLNRLENELTNSKKYGADRPSLMNTIKELRAAIREKDAHVENQEKRLARLQKAYNDLMQQLRSQGDGQYDFDRLSAEIDALTRELNDRDALLRDQQANYESTMNAIQQRVDELVKQAKSYKAEAANLKEKQHVSEQVIAKQDEQIRALKHALNNADFDKSHVQKLESTIERLRIDITQQERNYQQDIDDLRRNILAKEKNYQDLLARYEEQLSLKDTANADITERLGQELRSKELDIQNLRSNLNDKERALENYRIKIAEQERELNKLARVLQNKEAIIEDLQNKLAQQQEEYDRINLHLENKESSIYEINMQLRDKEMHIATLTSSLENKEQDLTNLSSRLQKKENDLSRLHNELRKYEMDAEEKDLALRAAIEDLRNLQNTSTLSLSLLEEESSQANKHAKTLKNKVYAQEEEIALLAEQLSIAELKIAQFDKLYDEKEALIEELEGQLTSTRDDLTSVRSHLHDKDGELDDLQAQIKGLESLRNSEGKWQKQIDALKKNLAMSENSLISKDQELKLLQTKYDDEHQLLVEKEQIIEGLWDEVNGLQKSLNSTTNDLDNRNGTIQKLRDELASLKDSLKAKESALVMSKPIIEEKEKQVGDLNKQLAKLNKDLAQANKRILDDTKRIERLNGEIEDLKGSHRDYKKADHKKDKEMANLMKQLAKSEKALNIVDENIDAQKMRFEDQIAKLDERLKNSQGRLDTAQKALDGKKRMVNSLQKEVGDYKSIITNQKRSIQKLKAKLDKTKEAMAKAKRKAKEEREKARSDDGLRQGCILPCLTGKENCGMSCTEGNADQQVKEAQEKMSKAKDTIRATMIETQETLIK